MHHQQQQQQQQQRERWQHTPHRGGGRLSPFLVLRERPVQNCPHFEINHGCEEVHFVDLEYKLAERVRRKNITWIVYN